jgi:hypothetical protein
MKSSSYQRYYEKNKEDLKAKMRERDAERREILRRHLAENPEEVGLEREKMRDKYYNNIGNKMRREIESMIKSNSVSDVGRAFLTECLVDDKYKAFTPKMIDAFKIIYAFIPPIQSPTVQVDGELR